MRPVLLAKKLLINIFSVCVFRDEQIVSEQQEPRTERWRDYRMKYIRLEGCFAFQHPVVVLEELRVPGI